MSVLLIPCTGQLGLDDESQRAVRHGIERPACREDQAADAGTGVDTERIEADDPAAGDEKSRRHAVRALDGDLVAGFEIAQEIEMRVAMGGDD